jgi:hypothetical protein
VLESKGNCTCLSCTRSDGGGCIPGPCCTYSEPEPERINQSFPTRS